MYQTGPVIAAMSQDMKGNLSHYFKTLQQQYTPHALAHEQAHAAAHRSLVQYHTAKVCEKMAVSNYDESRMAVRARHDARFAERSVPCKARL